MLKEQKCGHVLHAKMQVAVLRLYWMALCVLHLVPQERLKVVARRLAVDSQLKAQKTYPIFLSQVNYRLLLRLYRIQLLVPAWVKKQYNRD